MIEDLFPPPENTLTVLSMGAGQDSSCIWAMYKHDVQDFRKRYAPNDFILVTADTGDEHKETLAHIEFLKEDCAKEGVPYFHITNDMGFHRKTWPDLRTFYRTKNTIGSKGFPKVCTDALKLTPIYGFLEKYLESRYGVTAGDKRGFYEFSARYGKLRVLIGIAAGEERRLSDPSSNPKKWMRENVEVQYPLISYGLDRKGCQDMLRSLGEPVPMPSNCILCPWASLEELEYMRRNLPTDLAEWIQLERNKLDRFPHLNAVETVDKKTGKIKVVNKNYGVFGVVPLPEKVREAQERFKDWSDERLLEFKMSHGSCMSPY